MKAILLASLLFTAVGLTATESLADVETRVIKLADGVHTDPIDIEGDGATRVTIVGNDKNPEKVIVDVKGAPAIRVRKAIVTVSGVELRSTQSFPQLLAEDEGTIEFSNVRFSYGGQQVSARNGGRVRATGNYSIVVGGLTHLLAVRGGVIELAKNIVVTMDNAVYLAFFAGTNHYGVISIEPGVKFSGIASTAKFHVQNHGRISSGGLGIEGLPGGLPGVIETGGEYDGMRARP
ncbi:hypothetical protein JQ628_01230 [Bradyrhizobium lablabi]|uniref:hypothetical protein n=1 Tax=Bradyrhizobium lablabi TaxID=722472 RepID=UPI001BA9A00B|nr:hypothetical protein [Bradyrhizobium lablabi]MBR1120117.1 hypothetical protein [Bradyrhizobium lablabi]